MLNITNLIPIIFNPYTQNNHNTCELWELLYSIGGLRFQWASQTGEVSSQKESITFLKKYNLVCYCLLPVVI